MHILCVFLPLVEATSLASLGYFNPHLAEWGRCYVRAFPPDCDVLEDVECTRGAHARQLQFWTITVRDNVLFAFLLFSLVLIVWTVRRSSQHMQRYAYSSVDIFGAVTQQSIKYGTFFLFTYSFTAANVIVYHVSKGEESIAVFVIKLLREMFFPLQGFFTCLIYLQGNRSSRIRLETTFRSSRLVSNILRMNTSSSSNSVLGSYLIGAEEEDSDSSSAESDGDSREDLSIESDLPSTELIGKKCDSREDLSDIEDKNQYLHDDDASDSSIESDLPSTEFFCKPER